MDTWYSLTDSNTSVNGINGSGDYVNAVAVSSDGLKVYVGGIYGTKKIKNSVAIPEYCWKVVFNQKTGLILHILLFKNDNSCETKRVTLDEINRLSGYNIRFNSN